MRYVAVWFPPARGKNVLLNCESHILRRKIVSHIVGKIIWFSFQRYMSQFSTWNIQVIYQQNIFTFWEITLHHSAILNLYRKCAIVSPGLLSIFRLQVGLTIKWGLLSSGAYFPKVIFWKKSLSQKSKRIMYPWIIRIILIAK